MNFNEADAFETMDDYVFSDMVNKIDPTNQAWWDLSELTSLNDISIQHEIVSGFYW